MEPIELYRFTDLGLNHSDLELNLSDILSSRANIVGRFTYAFLLTINKSLFNIFVIIDLITQYETIRVVSCLSVYS